MWANAQRDGRPAKYRWRTLFNAAKFGWRPLLQCCAVTLPWRETHWNLQGCPKLPDRSQPLVGRSSPYCGDTWRRYCCLTSFFPIVDMCLSCKDIARQSCAMVPRWPIFDDFLGPAFSACRAQHVSDLHSKFALGPHYVSKYGRYPMCGRWDQARKKTKKIETTEWKYNGLPYSIGRPQLKYIKQSLQLCFPALLHRLTKYSVKCYLVSSNWRHCVVTDMQPSMYIFKHIICYHYTDDQLYKNPHKTLTLPTRDQQ